MNKKKKQEEGYISLAYAFLLKRICSLGLLNGIASKINQTITDYFQYIDELTTAKLDAEYYVASVL